MLGIVFVFLPKRRKKINVSFKRTFRLATHLVQTFEWFSIWNNGLTVKQENFRFAESNSGTYAFQKAFKTVSDFMISAVL